MIDQADIHRARQLWRELGECLDRLEADQPEHLPVETSATPQTWDEAVQAGWLEPGRAAGLFGMTESWALKRARQGYGAKFGTGRWLIDVARLRADQA
ncbi:hypothetical protein FKB34_11375 [Glycocaulis profundi]|nr:hypothetical protein FKB34_11375 [Glycocaulis profundi]